LNPTIEREQVRTDDEGGKKCSHSEKENFSPVSVTCRESKRRVELMMNFVNVWVDEWKMKKSMLPVLKEVFKEHEKCEMKKDSTPGREGVVITNAKNCSKRKEDKTQRQYHTEIIN
jgi:hypothetical protein